MSDCDSGCPEHTCLSCCNDRRVQLEAEVKEHELRREAMQLCIDTRDAEIARLRLAILNAIPSMPGGQAKADLRDAYDGDTAGVSDA